MRRIMRIMHYNPQWLVRRAQRYERSRVRLQGRKLYRWIKRYRHRPLHMLGECYGKTCPNSRFAYPYRRKQLVHCAINLLQTRLGSSIDRLECVFLGSGGLLQEIILLSQLYAFTHIQCMNIVCCDEEYMSNDRDEALILQERFHQAAAWMARIASHTTCSWSMVNSWENIIFDTQRPTLLIAADMTITAALWEKICATAQDSKRCAPFIAVTLDDYSIVYVVKD